MKHLLLIFSICLITNLYAQESPVSYVWHYGVEGPGDDFIGALAVDEAGNTIFAGSFEDTIVFGDTMFIAEEFIESGYVAKLDPDGMLLWAKELKVSDGVDITIFDIEIFPGGSFALAGSLWGTLDADLSEEEFILESDLDDIFVAIYSSDGDVQLASTIRGMGTNERALEMTYDNNNGLYLGGYIDDGESFNDSPILVKVDIGENPAILWDYTFATPGSNDDIKGIAATPDHVYVAGTFEGAIDFMPGDGELILDAGEEEDVFILKLTSDNAEVVWAKQFTALASNVFAGDMTMDAQENLYITGWVRDSTDFDPGEEEFILVPSIRDPYLAKLNSDGELIWATLAGQWQGEKVLLDSESNVFMSGESLDGGQIIKFSLDGDLLWEANFRTTSIFGFDFGDFFIDGNDDYYLGMEFSNPFFYNPETMDTLVSIDDDDDFAIVKYTEGQAVTSIFESLNEADVNIFPNPIVNQLNIEWNTISNSTFKMWIIDVEGKVINTHEFYTAETANIPFPYPAGNYFIQLADAEQVFRPIKILKP